MIGYELYRLLSMKKDKKPRKKRKADAKLEAEKEKDEKKSDPPTEDTQVKSHTRLCFPASALEHSANIGLQISAFKVLNRSLSNLIKYVWDISGNDIFATDNLNSFFFFFL